MQKIKFGFAAAMVAFSFNAFSQVHSPQCQERNARIENAFKNSKGTQDACYKQLKESSEKCNQTPDLGDDEVMDSGLEIASTDGGLNSSWEWNENVHKTTMKKYLKRAQFCRDEIEKVNKACDAFETNKGNGQQTMVEALEIGAKCDTIFAEVEKNEADTAAMYKERAGSGKEEPVGPGTEAPSGKLVDGYGKGVSGNMRADGSVPQDTLHGTVDGHEPESAKAKLAKGVGMTVLDTVSSAAPHVPSSAVPLLGAGYAAWEGNYFEAAKSTASAGARIAGWGAAETVLGAGTAAYLGMTAGAAVSGGDDAPLDRAHKSISIMSHPGH